jgi:hypothetical protein
MYATAGAKLVRRIILSLAVATTVTTAGCVAAAAAGAAGGIYATTRGVESLVDGPIDDVGARAQAVMREMGITEEGSSIDAAGAKREFKGKQGDLDVTVQLERRDTATTKVEVYARKNLAEWDKDYARQVLGRIVKQS